MDVNVPLNASIITDDPIRYTTYFVVSLKTPMFTKATRTIIVIIDKISFIVP